MKLRYLAPVLGAAAGPPVQFTPQYPYWEGDSWYHSGSHYGRGGHR